MFHIRIFASPQARAAHMAREVWYSEKSGREPKNRVHVAKLRVSIPRYPVELPFRVGIGRLERIDRWMLKNSNPEPRANELLV